MIGALVVLACVGLCVAVGMGPLPTTGIEDPDSAHAKSLRHLELRVAGSVLAASAFMFGTLFAGGFGKWWAMTPLAGGLVIATLCLHPWVLVRAVCIPLGQVRWAYRLSRLGGAPWMRDPQGGAVLAASLALLRRARPCPRLGAWLEGQLCRGPLGGAGIVAAGLLAADRGDRAAARALFESCDALDPAVCPPVARRAAHEWRIADAMASGRFADAAAIAKEVVIPSRTTRFVALASAALAGDTVRRSVLLRAWLRAPRRCLNLQLLRRAWSVPPARAGVEVEHGLDELPANDAGPPLFQALALHGEAAVTDAPLPSAVVRRLGEAWDLALSDLRLHRLMSERARIAQAPVPGSSIIARIRTTVTSDLATLARRWRIPHTDLNTGAESTLGHAVATLRERLLVEVEVTADAVGKRRNRRPSISAIEEWRAWLAIRQVYDNAAAIGGLALRQDAYPVVEEELRRTAAWLWHDHGERSLAIAISTWLLFEAEHVDDRDAAAFHRNAVAVGV